MKIMTRNVSLPELVFIALLFTGNVFASDCDINVSQPHVDFGTFNRGTLSQADSGTEHKIIGNKASILTIICPRPEHITVFYRAASGSSADDSYQLGDIASVSLILSDAQADGKSTLLSYQREGGLSTSENQKILPLLPNIGVTPAVSDPVTTLVMKLTSVATVNDADIHIKDHKVLNSTGTLEVVSE